MLWQVQPSFPLLDSGHHRHLCETLEGSPRDAGAISARVRGLGVR